MSTCTAQPETDDPDRLIGETTYWRFYADGSVLPNVHGGSPDKDDDADDDQGADDDDDDAGDEDDDSSDDDKSKKVDHAAEALKWKRLARKHERDLKALRKKPAAKDGDDDAAKAAVDKAREEAKTEVLTATKSRLALAEVRATAASLGVKNAKRLARLVNLDDIDVSDDGEVDEDDVDREVKAVLKEFPELAGKKADDDGDDEDGKGKKKPPAGETGRRREPGKGKSGDEEEDDQSIDDLRKELSKARTRR